MNQAAGVLTALRRLSRPWSQLPARIQRTAVKAPLTADRGRALLGAWQLVERQRAAFLARIPANLVELPPQLVPIAHQLVNAMAVGIAAVGRLEAGARGKPAMMRPRILARRPGSELAGEAPAALRGLAPGETEAHFLARLRAVRDPQTVADLLTYFVSQLHGVSVAINQAKARDDRAGVKGLLPLFIIARNRYLAAGATADQLSAFDRQILALGNYVAAVVHALPEAIAAVPAGIFEGIWKAVQLPVILAAGGFLVYKIATRTEAPAR